MSDIQRGRCTEVFACGTAAIVSPIARQSSGPVPPFTISRLAARSNAIVRPMLFHYIRDRAALETMAKDTFEALEHGVIQAQVGLRPPLARAAEAHIAL